MTKTSFVETPSQIANKGLYSHFSHTSLLDALFSPIDILTYGDQSQLSSNAPATISSLTSSNACPFTTNDLKCYSGSPCGCTLYPSVSSSSNNNNLIANKKGIADACEIVDPLINSDYFDQYRIRINCQNPYQTINPDTCQPANPWFYIGEGYPLTKSDMKTNFTDIRLCQRNSLGEETLQLPELRNPVHCHLKHCLIIMA